RCAYRSGRTCADHWRALTHAGRPVHFTTVARWKRQGLRFSNSSGRCESSCAVASSNAPRMLEAGAPLEQHAGAPELSAYATSSAFCAASCACSHAAGSVSVTFFAIGHNAEFNVRHALLPPARNEYQGESRHYPLRRTQGTEKHARPALCPEGEYRPPYP